MSHTRFSQSVGDELGKSLPVRAPSRLPGYAAALISASRRFITRQNVPTAFALCSKKSSKKPGLFNGRGYE
jgi:hypothetical protein